jgi:hypothetical protein
MQREIEKFIITRSGISRCATFEIAQGKRCPLPAAAFSKRQLPVNHSIPMALPSKAGVRREIDK